MKIIIKGNDEKQNTLYDRFFNFLDTQAKKFYSLDEWEQNGCYVIEFEELPKSAINYINNTQGMEFI